MNTTRTLVVSAAVAIPVAMSSAAHAQEKGRLAVFGCEAAGEAAAFKQDVDQGVAEAARNAGRFEILRDADIFKILQFDPQIAIKNCGDDPLCISQLGDTIKTFWIMKTTIRIDGGKARIEVQVFGVGSAKLLAALSAEAPVPGADLKTETEKLTHAVLKKIGTGNIKIDEPSFGEVMVDGVPSGTIPCRIEGVAAGVHTLRIVSQGADLWTGEVKVEVGETVTVNTKKEMPAAAAFAPAPPPRTGPGLLPPPAAAETVETVKPAEPPKPARPLPPPLDDPYFYVASGATVGSFVVAIAMSAAKSSDEGAARDEPIQTKAREHLDSASTKATVANVFYGLGIAAAIWTGVIVYMDVFMPRATATSWHVEPRVDARSASALLSATF